MRRPCASCARGSPNGRRVMPVWRARTPCTTSPARRGLSTWCSWIRRSPPSCWARRRGCSRSATGLSPGRSSTWSARRAPACPRCRRRGDRSRRSRRARSVIICLRTLRLWQPTPYETQRRLSGHLRSHHQRPPRPGAARGRHFRPRDRRDRGQHPQDTDVPAGEARRAGARRAERPHERGGAGLLGTHGRFCAPAPRHGDRARLAGGVGSRVRVSARQHVACPRPQLRDRVPDAAGTLHLHLLDPGARDRGAGRGRESVRPSDRGGRAEETAAPLRSAATLACADRAPRHQLEGAWVPIAASVAGSRLAVGELRVRYLLLEAGGYSIIDRSNHVVDGGRYLVNEELSPATMDIVGGSGPHAGRTMRAIYELRGDELTVCYDLEGGERPANLQPQQDRLLLRITYSRAAILFSQLS